MYKILDIIWIQNCKTGKVDDQNYASKIPFWGPKVE